MRKRKLVDANMEPKGTAQWKPLADTTPLTRATGHEAAQTLRVIVRDRSETAALAYIAEVCGEVLGVDPEYRTAVEGVEALIQQVAQLRAERDDLRRHDLREKLKCPRCGGWIVCEYGSDLDVWWGCWKCQALGPHRSNQIDALLAWHEEKE